MNTRMNELCDNVKFGLKIAAVYGIALGGVVGLCKIAEYRQTPITTQHIQDVRLGEEFYEIALSGHDDAGNKVASKVKSIDRVVEMDMEVGPYPSSGRYWAPHAEIVTYNSGRTQTTLYVLKGTL